MQTENARFFSVGSRSTSCRFYLSQPDPNMVRFTFFADRKYFETVVSIVRSRIRQGFRHTECSEKSPRRNPRNRHMVIENESDFLADRNFDHFGSRSSRIYPRTTPDPNWTVLVIWEHHDPKAITMYRFEKNKIVASKHQKNRLDRLLIHRNHFWTDSVVRRLNSRPEGSVRSIRSLECRIRYSW